MKVVMVKKVIKAYPDKCVNCKLCEISCSMTKEGKIFPLYSRIEIIDFSPLIKFPVQCYHCDEPLCAKICPTNSLYRDPKNGLIKFNYETCIHCRKCAEACPFGSISIGIDGRVFKCNQCEEILDGAPQCVLSCPYGALEYIEPQDDVHAKREKFVEKYMKEIGL
ncbi:MAG: 4Fe-4S dicluster domain-containing protein [Candidatus Helarchaeota archaeon]